MSPLRKTLPAGVQELLTTGSFEDVTAALARCQVGAVQRDSFRTQLLHLDECSDELVRWAVARGDDVNAPDAYGRTPLHHRAQGKHAQIPLLLELGADVDARDKDGRTPLVLAAQAHRSEAIEMLLGAGADPNAASMPAFGEALDPLAASLENALWRLPETLAQVERLMVSGARPTELAHAPLWRLGHTFERIAAEGAASEDDRAALNRLYQVWDQDPVPRIEQHNGSSPVELPEGPWQQQYAHLWDTLVPRSGKAATAQGEVIRLIGRLAHEILDNGSVNWRQAFREEADELGALLASRDPLPKTQLDEARSLVDRARTGRIEHDEMDRLTELAVAWVRRNPRP